MLMGFLISFALISLMELGDKTQLLILSLMLEFKDKKKVIGGALCAFILLTGTTAMLGHILLRILPRLIIGIISAAIFLFFGLHTLLVEARRETVEGNEKRYANKFVSCAFLTSFLAIALAEIGDKTQLTVLALASSWDNPIVVFAGAMLGLGSICTLTAVASELITRRLSLKKVRILSGCLFILTSLLMLIEFT